MAMAVFGAFKVVGVIGWKVKGLEAMTTEPLFVFIFILGGISWLVFWGTMISSTFLV